jgi:hypothetical protein
MHEKFHGPTFCAVDVESSAVIAAVVCVDPRSIDARSNQPAVVTVHMKQLQSMFVDIVWILLSVQRYLFSAIIIRRRAVL